MLGGSTSWQQGFPLLGPPVNRCIMTANVQLPCSATTGGMMHHMVTTEINIVSVKRMNLLGPPEKETLSVAAVGDS